MKTPKPRPGDLHAKHRPRIHIQANRTLSQRFRHKVSKASAETGTHPRRYDADAEDSDFDPGDGSCVFGGFPAGFRGVVRHDWFLEIVEEDTSTCEYLRDEAFVNLVHAIKAGALGKGERMLEGCRDKLMHAVGVVGRELERNMAVEKELEKAEYERVAEYEQVLEGAEMLMSLRYGDGCM